MSSPIASGAVGELFWQVADAVILLSDGCVAAWNPAAERMFDLRPVDGMPLREVLGPRLGPAYERLQALVDSSGSARLDARASCDLVLDVTSWQLTGSDIRVLMLRDVADQVRLSDGLARMSELGRELLESEPSMPDLLQHLVDEAKSLARADFSALLLLRGDDTREVSHFAYNAPRELFPERLPRVVGLLSVPVATGQLACLDDIRGHPAGVGIPVKHPPIGPLLAVPVLAGDVLIGEVAVANAPEHRQFNHIDEQLLTDLAAHIGIGVRWAQTREAAAAAAEARREIIATARHDIRNPLTIAKGYVSMLERRRAQMSGEQVDSAISAVRVALERIEDFAHRALVDDGVDPGGESPRWSSVDLPAMIEAVGTDHMAANRDAGVQVVTVIEPDTPDEFAGDPGMVREVLDNLVSNAVKYGAPGSPITLTARAEGAQVRFDVHNCGDGIPAHDQGKLFEQYWRSGQVREQRIPGSGLGLSIVRRLVQLHHGFVGVSSRVDEGTTFWVTFPRSVPAEAAAADA